MYLNGERLSIKSFADYVDLYLGPSPKDGGPPRVYERVHERWEVCVSPTDGQFQQVGKGLLVRAAHVPYFVKALEW